MTLLLRYRCRIAFIVGLAAGVAAQAQTLAVGPSAWYLISSDLPEGTESESQPTRYLVGASALWQVNTKASIRATIGYRSESGVFNTPESQSTQPAQTASQSQVQVVVGPGNAPAIVSNINASSVEVTAMLCFPIMPLDTSGAALGIGIGGLADVMLDASQADDYSAIASHQGQTVINTAYKQQVGYGALIGAFLSLPIGSSTLSFDVQYVFRLPTTLTTATAPLQHQDTGWLIGKGLRVGATLYFGLF